MTPQASKTCEVWIPLNPSVFSSGCFRIPDGVFPLFSLFWIITNFSQGSFPLIHCCWMPFTVGCPSFHSTILGLSGVPLISSICYPEYQNQCCVSNISDWPLPILRGPKRLVFFFSKTSRYHLFRPTFWLLSFLSFFLNGQIPFHQAKRFPATFLHSPSFWIPRDTRPLFMNC